MDDDSLYLLLNIHTLDDVILLKFVSTDFRKEINIYEPKKDHSKRPRNNQKIFDDAGFGETPKFTSEVDKSIHLDPQKVEILALNTSSRKLELVLDFYLKAECCLKASASSDYAILKVPCGKNQTTGLQKCQLGLNAATYSIYDSMSVHVFGFPSALSEFQHDYTVNLSSISGSDSEGCMVITGLSSPGLSGSAIVCTVQGWPIGYLGGEVTSGESKVHQYQAYGYALFGIMSVLKDILPRFKRPKIQKGDQE